MQDIIICSLTLVFFNALSGFFCAKYSIGVWKITERLKKDFIKDNVKTDLKIITYIFWPTATTKVFMLNKKFLPINLFSKSRYVFIMSIVGLPLRIIFNSTILFIRVFLKAVISPTKISLVTKS